MNMHLGCRLQSTENMKVHFPNVWRAREELHTKVVALQVELDCFVYSDYAMNHGCRIFDYEQGETNQ